MSRDRAVRNGVSQYEGHMWHMELSMCTAIVGWVCLQCLLVARKPTERVSEGITEVVGLQASRQ